MARIVIEYDTEFGDTFTDDEDSTTCMWVVRTELADQIAAGLGTPDTQHL